ncbi:MAG TPA: hypothetical protein VM076_20885 [Gemmatimonadaceae bacterium]|nr:hypothetical protein [Gemmatimonadaceae bacterium]
MKPVMLFAAITLTLIACAGWIMTLVFESPAASRAVWTSAAVAFAVQLLAFVIVKLSAKTNVIAGWGVGAIVRFVVLAVYALVFVKLLGLPSGAALMSLAAFFFLSTLIEPLLLKS